MKLKKLLALLLAAVMMLSLAACAGTSDDDDDEGTSSGGGKETIVGEWIGEMEFGAAINATLLAEDESFGKYFDFGDIELKMIFTFDDNGELTIEPDEDSLEDMVDDVIDIMLDGYEKLFADQGMSLEDMNMSKDDLREEVEKQLDADALAEMAEEIAEDGYYVIVDDRIYTDSDEDNLENPEDDASGYMEFKLSGDTLTIKDMVADGESVKDSLDGIVPFKLKRN